MKLSVYEIPVNLQHKFTLSHVQLMIVSSRLITEGWMMYILLLDKTVHDIA